MGKTKTKSRSVGDSPKPPITIRSTNPKILDDNIAKLEKAIQASDVSANPSGTAEETLLSTIGIDGKKYDLGPSAENTSYDNTDSGLTADNVQAAIDEVSSASGISYDNTDSGLTADDTQGAIDEVVSKIKTYDTLLDSALTTESAEYNLAHDKRDYNLICIAVAWANGANSNFITLPPTAIYNGSTKIYLNGDTASDYATISLFGNTSITALASNSNVYIRIYGIM